MIKIPKRQRDLTGLTFGLLTVERVATRGEIEEHYSEKKTRDKLWVCRCVCGNVTMRTYGNLNGSIKAGNVASCGCWRKGRYVSQYNDMLGHAFGKLTPLSFDYESYGGKSCIAVFKCLCQCGNITRASKYDLVSGHKKSCGCVADEHNRTCLRDFKKINIAGKTYGNLYVIEETDKRDAPGCVMWLCKCKCGAYTKVSTTHLTSGATRSCGCTKSRGEEAISNILSEAKIAYEPQYHFDDLRGKSKKFLQFDFGVLHEDGSLSHLIEFDGEQHFKPIEKLKKYYGRNMDEEFKRIKARDERKNKYCLDNNIPLIRIPYTHFKNLCLDDLMLSSTSFLYNRGGLC